MSKVNDSSMLKMVAIATNLMPGKQFVNYQEIENLHRQYSAVLVEDSEHEKYLLLAAKGANSAQFDEEIAITETIAKQFKNKKFQAFFDIPQIIATAPNLAVLTPYSGRAFAPGALTSGQVKALAIALAKIHSASFSLVEENAAIVHKVAETNAQTRAGLISALDEITALKLVPASLLARFENFLRDDNIWSYDSAVIHGQIVPRNILFTGDDISCILEWARIQIGDCALDLAGIVPALTDENTVIFYDAYRKFRAKFAGKVRPDRHLQERVEFYHQFELALKLLNVSRAKTRQSENRAETDEIVKKLVAELELLDKKLLLEAELDLAEEQARKVAENRQKQMQNLQKEDTQYTQKMMRTEIISAADNTNNTQKNADNSNNSKQIEDELTKMLNEQTIQVPVGPRATFEAPVIHASTNSAVGVESRKQFNIEDFLED